jgi:hypothetical protein
MPSFTAGQAGVDDLDSASLLFDRGFPLRIMSLMSPEELTNVSRNSAAVSHQQTPAAPPPGLRDASQYMLYIQLTESWSISTLTAIAVRLQIDQRSISLPDPPHKALDQLPLPPPLKK